MRWAVILEDSDTGRQVWESSRDGHTLPDIFPGFLNDPKGILGIFEGNPDLQKVCGEGMLPILLSNGQTREVPEKDLRWLS
jgi:hypothetical protein